LFGYNPEEAAREARESVAVGSNQLGMMEEEHSAYLA
jgi:hypothetical protein